jgi:predicted short-subunit dehydrogenase-like oxidoreductase (DUF2520 family)
MLGHCGSAEGAKCFSQGRRIAPRATRSPWVSQKKAISPKKKIAKICMQIGVLSGPQVMLARMNKSLSIVGAGRVGRGLGRKLRKAGWNIGSIVTRSEATARKATRFIGAGAPQATVTRDVASSQVILVTTPDDELARASEMLARVCGKALRGKTVLHTSGANGADVLRALKSCGASVGSMHPMQSFSGVKEPSLKGVRFAIDGDTTASGVARKIVNSLGGVPLRVNGGKKALYHAAGVMAAGHTLALMEGATRMLMASGLTRREALRALLPLTREVLDNFEQLGAHAAWTGPLARDDYEVIRAHRKALRELPKEFGAAYDAVNRLAALLLAKKPDAAKGKLRAGSEKKN